MYRSNFRLFAFLLSTVFLVIGCQAQVPNPDQQIAEAVLPLQENLRDGATVLGYTEAGDLVTVREGTNDMTCIADRPGDEQFHTSCYHNSLEAYMARGRELRAEGVERQESFDIRHREADEGTLQMPERSAVVVNVSGERASFDPETAAVTLYAVYIPYATEANTGVTEQPGPPGTPWIMRAGTPSAHIMIIPPKPSGN